MLVFFLKYSIIFLIFCIVYILLACSNPDCPEHDYPIKEKIIIALHVFMTLDAFVLFILYIFSADLVAKNYI